MCGRFYANAKTAEEIVKIAGKTAQPALGSSGDIFPSGMAAILLGKEHRLRAARMLWGFPGFHGKGLIINARAETVLERRMFRDSVEHRRCVIPAKGFYEWNRDREKYFYEKEDEPVLWMAGFYNRFQDQDRFVILTTAANASVAPVHGRMPLILERKELESWVLDDKAADVLLHKTPALLKSSAEYTQLSLF